METSDRIVKGKPTAGTNGIYTIKLAKDYCKAGKRLILGLK